MKVTIVVDDGAATGLTLLLAVQVLRERHPRKIMVGRAVPVAPLRGRCREAQGGVADRAEGSSGGAPPYFEAVGAYYQQFPQLTDEEVIDLNNKRLQQ
jgi:putative phosphoribosyl transferase